MIRSCTEADFDAIHSIINDAAVAYRGVIPADCWHEPYMTREALASEIASGVRFWGMEQDGTLVGVMGIQEVKDVTLIRHAYVKTSHRRGGIGAQLLRYLRSLTQRPLLIGTWAAADWAIRFYEKNGFRLADGQQKDVLLSRYWTIPERQRQTSVVLVEVPR